MAAAFACPACERSFASKIGLGVHLRHKHVELANARVGVERSKQRWSEEEMRMLASVEVQGVLSGARLINEYIMRNLQTERTLEAIKGTRKQAKYKTIFAVALEDAKNSVRDPASDKSDEGDVGGAGHSSTPTNCGGQREDDNPVAGHESFEFRIKELMEQLRGATDFHAELLVSVAERQLRGEDVAEALTVWRDGLFRPAKQQRKQPPKRRRARKRSTTTNNNKTTKWRERRKEYAAMQTLFQRNTSLAASVVLDGKKQSRQPELAEMTHYWEPILSRVSAEYRADKPVSEKSELDFIWSPIVEDELKPSAPPLQTAPGRDGITARQWRAVPANIKALLYNIVLMRGGFPTAMLESRTVFLPKKQLSVDPADFRPISIASVIVRQLHKILAMRLRRARLIDERQRCMDDGCAENVTVLASLLDSARHSLKELHIVSLDCAKAYDSVSHDAIRATLGEYGLPAGFVQYISRTYSSSTTVLEVGKEKSEPIHVKQGVRQGDPLSTLLFCLCFDRITRTLPNNIGYDFNGTRINSLLYADDAFLVSSTVSGMRVLLKAAESAVGEVGLSFNASKCSALSLVPSGREKKIKVVTTPTFKTTQGNIAQITPSQEWRYLGVDFQYCGPKKASRTLRTELENISRAPLKPQQRLLFLRAYLMPRYYHHLVLSRVTLCKLKALDLQVRAAVRRWLALPKDVPTAYFHTSTKEGGLGLPAFETFIPVLMLRRLESLAVSTCEAARAAHCGFWVQRRISWARNALNKNGEILTNAGDVEQWWAKRLHASVDGRELRECSSVRASSAWVNSAMKITGRDYLQYHHIRINTIPTRVRTSRGSRRDDMDVKCRAGCQVSETAAHVIQSCHRTHGGRIKRHDAVCEVLASGLRDKGWMVRREPRLRTRQGLRKPDIVAVKDGAARVIDAQIVSGAKSLHDTHNTKRQYYANNSDVSVAIARAEGIDASNIRYSTCTISWRGVWAASSAADLIALGLSQKLLGFITLRVLRGSHTNWTRWGKMTTMRTDHQREGIG